MTRMAVLSAVLALATLAGTASAKVVATGGDATHDVGYYRIHVFTNVDDHVFDVTAGGEIAVPVVGGGGDSGTDGSIVFLSIDSSSSTVFLLR